jgi:branched-chain amino acid transport system substrate-binding protein
MSTRGRFLTAAAGLGAAAALPTIVRAAVPTVRIGYIDSMSGPFAIGGLTQVTGARLAIEDANRRSGGRVKWELVEGDDTSRPAVAITQAQRLVENEHVDALAGGASSAVGLALSAYAQEHGLLYVAVGAHDTDMTGKKANKVAFRQTASLAMLSDALGATLVRRAKRWYFLVADYAFGTDARDRLRTILYANGGHEVGSDLHPVGTADFSPYMTKAAQTDAEAFLILNGGADTQNAAKAFVQFGLQKKMLAAGVTGENELAAGFPAEELAGSLWGYVWGPESGGRARDLHRRLATVTGGKFPSNWRQYLGYMAVSNIVNRMEAAGTTDTAAVVKAFEGYHYDAYKAQGAYFRACDHQAVQEVYCAELLPEAKRKEPGEYFRIVSAIGGDVAAGPCTTVDSARATAIMTAQTIPARDGYAAKTLRG